MCLQNNSSTTSFLPCTIAGCLLVRQVPLGEPCLCTTSSKQQAWAAQKEYSDKHRVKRSMQSPGGGEKSAPSTTLEGFFAKAQGVDSCWVTEMVCHCATSPPWLLPSPSRMIRIDLLCFTSEGEVSKTTLWCAGVQKLSHWSDVSESRTSSRMRRPRWGLGREPLLTLKPSTIFIPSTQQFCRWPREGPTSFTKGGRCPEAAKNSSHHQPL